MLLTFPWYVSLLRCGSISIDLGLNFNSTIREREVIDILRDAAKDGMLGDFEVDVLSIVGTRPIDEKPTKAATTSPSSSSDSMFLFVSVGIFNGYKIIAQCASVHFLLSMSNRAQHGCGN